MSVRRIVARSWFVPAFVAMMMLTKPLSAGNAGAGDVLPASASPSGYSLTDMAEELAYFDTSGNNTAYLPAFPFQVLYINDTNTFTVKTGTRFFVPMFSIDDSPPIIGDFPTDPSQTADYIFGQDEIGLTMSITVDGKTTPLGPAYVAGPVTAPDLLDGGGSHIIQGGVFLTPLPKGVHTISLHNVYTGDAIVALYGPLEFITTYTVTVK